MLILAAITAVPVVAFVAIIAWARCRAGALDDAAAERELRQYRQHEGDDSVVWGPQEPRGGEESSSGAMDASLGSGARYGAPERIVPFAGFRLPELVYADDEVCAMDAVVHALEPLDEDARARVIAWAVDRYRTCPSREVTDA